MAPPIERHASAPDRAADDARSRARSGNFYATTLLGAVPRETEVFSNETFGLVAPLFRFCTEAEAIATANNTSFGLAAYVYTCDVSRMFRVGETLESGIVGVNEGIVSTEVAPFGGVKASGLGREDSKYGIEDYLELKMLCLNGIGAWGCGSVAPATRVSGAPGSPPGKNECR